MSPMAVLVSAYHGPPRLTLGRAFTEWTADPGMIALVVVLGLCYLAGVYQVRRRGGQWRTVQVVEFCGLGLGFLVIATMSWIGVYQNILFYARATQTVLLVLLVPIFLAMGKPMTLFIEVFPGPGELLVKAVRSRVVKFATFPLVTSLLLAGVPMSMYFTNWYTASFHSGTVRELTYLVLLADGYVFFWTMLRADPVPKEYPYGVGLWITAAEMVGDAFFGLAVIADMNLLASSYYHSVGWPYGPSLATDQVIGGGIIWVLGDIVGLPFLVVQFARMMRADKTEAAAIDAELDAKEAARAARKAAREEQRRSLAAWRAGEDYQATRAAPAPAAAGASPVADERDGGGEDDADRPWWEDDPRFTNRFRGALPPPAAGAVRAISVVRADGQYCRLIPNSQPESRVSLYTSSWDFRPHQEGMSVYAAGSSARTATTWPTGTSWIRSASMMIGMGHSRPRASIVSRGVRAARAVILSGEPGWLAAPWRLPNTLTLTMVPHTRPGTLANTRGDLPAARRVPVA